MADRDFQEKLQQLRCEVKQVKEMEKRARAELERKKATLIDKKTQYLHLKLQNDLLDVELVVELQQKGEETKKCIQELEKQKEEVRAETAAELAIKQERNDTLDAFSKDVKTAIVQIEAELRRRKVQK